MCFNPIPSIIENAKTIEDLISIQHDTNFSLANTKDNDPAPDPGVNPANQLPQKCVSGGDKTTEIFLKKICSWSSSTAKAGIILLFLATTIQVVVIFF